MVDSPEMRRALAVVKWVQSNIKLARWDLNDYERLLGKRSIAEILGDRRTNYMFPCPDRTATAGVLMRERGFDPTLVLQERISTRSNKPTIHFAIEVPIGGVTHTIDFKTPNEVVFYKGGFKPELSSSGRSLGLHRFSMQHANRSSTILTFVGIRGIDELGKVTKHCESAHLRAMVEAMRRADKPKVFERMTKGRNLVRRL